MLAGRRNKARSGELFNHAPIGFVRLLGAGMALDSDEQGSCSSRRRGASRQGEPFNFSRQMITHT